MFVFTEIALSLWQGVVTPPLVLSEEKYFSILSQIIVCPLNQAQVRTVLAIWLLEQRCSYSFTSYSLEAVNIKVKLKKKNHNLHTVTENKTFHS